MKHLNGKPLIYWTINSVKKPSKKQEFLLALIVKKLQILVKLEYRGSFIDQIHI